MSRDNINPKVIELAKMAGLEVNNIEALYRFSDLIQMQDRAAHYDMRNGKTEDEIVAARIQSSQANSGFKTLSHVVGAITSWIDQHEGKSGTFNQFMKQHKLKKRHHRKEQL